MLLKRFVYLPYFHTIELEALENKPKNISPEDPIGMRANQRAGEILMKFSPSPKHLNYNHNLSRGIDEMLENLLSTKSSLKNDSEISNDELDKSKGTFTKYRL